MAMLGTAEHRHLKTTGSPKGGRTFFHNEMSLSDTMRDALLTVDLMDHTPDAPETNSATISDHDLKRAHGFGRIVV